jgi:Fic family protein
MAYIYKKIIGGKAYYYLRVSKRKGKTVISKDIAYLGADVTKIMEKLDKLPAKYKKEIRKAYKNIKKLIDSNYYSEKVGKLKVDPYFNKDIQRNVEATSLHFDKHFKKLHYKTIMETYENFLIDFAYNTTSIEGNTITLKEADKLLREDLTPKEKSSREIFDLQNTKRVFFYLLKEKTKFNQDLIIEIHDMLLQNIDERKGFRTHDVRVFKSHFDTSPGKYVKTDMNLLFDWYNQHKNELHPLVLVGLFHQKFEKIHPFSDGNGRTGRIVMNYLLIQRDYAPLIIKKKNRKNYLNTLSKADKSNLNSVDPKYFKPLIEYLSNELIKSYWENFSI